MSGDFLSTWNSEAGFEIMTRPLFNAVAIQVGGRYYFLTILPSNESVFELSAGLIWGIL